MPGRRYLGIEMCLGHEGAREESSSENGINLTSVCCLPLGPRLVIGVRGKGPGFQAHMDIVLPPVFKDRLVFLATEEPSLGSTSSKQGPLISNASIYSSMK